MLESGKKDLKDDSIHMTASLSFRSKDFFRIVERCLLASAEYYRLEHDEELYVAMRRLYIESLGESSIVINQEVSRVRPTERLVHYSDADSQLIPLGATETIKRDLRSSGGYAKVALRLNQNWVEEIKELLDRKEQDTSPEQTARIFISDWNTLSKTRIIQELYRDNALRNIVDCYLGCRAYLNAVCAWKTIYQPRTSHDVGRDAMSFHFDCDHNRFIKIFIYLDDVTARNGPHVYIEKTSAQYRKYLPEWLNRDGRLSSLEVINSGLTPNVVTGAKGTAIFADTQNLHRGTPVHYGAERYMLQLQFVDSVFGARPAHSSEHIEDMNMLAFSRY